MRKMKRVVFLLAAIAACVLCLCAFGSKVKVFSDNFDRPERFARYWNHNAGGGSPARSNTCPAAVPTAADA